MDIKIITPSEGMWLTQATISEDSERVFSKQVINPTSEWVEWSDADKVAWEEVHKFEEPLNE